MQRSPRHKKHTLCLFNKIVLAIGYLSIAYWAARGVIYLLVVLGGAS